MENEEMARTSLKRPPTHVQPSFPTLHSQFSMLNSPFSIPSPTTAQQLGSIVKSARDIMRKDKGLNGDLDRLPMLTWIMFLKFLDDMEQIREQEAELEGTR